MIERRIDQLTRDMRDPKRVPLVPLDEDPLDHALRLVAMLILMLLLFAFATWPRDDATQAEPVRAEQPVALPAAPAWGGRLDADTYAGTLQYSPIY
ncbi:MAG TPA: hypothetical protein VNU21_15385 [Usitatibacter sp.]|jgi:hypothetical protein|nr:hypothetical protein [Usitatibacter sp.]